MCLQLLAMFVGTSCCCSRYCIQSIFALNMAFLYVICLCMGVRAIQIWICVSSLIQGKVEYWYLDFVPSSFPKGEYIFRFILPLIYIWEIYSFTYWVSLKPSVLSFCHLCIYTYTVYVCLSVAHHECLIILANVDV